MKNTGIRYVFAVALYFMVFLPMYAQDSVQLINQSLQSWEIAMEGESNKAQIIANQTLSAAKGKNFWPVMANCHSTLGYIKFQEGDTVLGYFHMKNCILYRRLAGDSTGVANAYNTLANFESNIGNYPVAIEHALLAGRILEGQKEQKTESERYWARLGSNYLTLAKIYSNDRELSTAKEYALKGYEILSRYPHKMGNAALCLANRYYDLIDHEKNLLPVFINSLSDSAEIFYQVYLKSAQSGEEEVIVYHNLAHLMLNTEPVNWARAEDYLQSAYHTFFLDDHSESDNQLLFLLYQLEANIQALRYKNINKSFGLLSKACNLNCLYALEANERLNFFIDYSEAASALGQNLLAFQLSQSARRLQDTLFNESAERQKRKTVEKDREAKLLIERKEKETVVAQEKLKRQRLTAVIVLLLLVSVAFLTLLYLDRKNRNLQVQQKVKMLSNRFSDNLQRTLRKEFATELHDRIGTPLASLASVAEVITQQTAPQSDIRKLSEMLQNNLRERAKYARTLSHQLEMDGEQEDYDPDIQLGQFLKDISDIINTAGLIKMQYVYNLPEDPAPAVKTCLGLIIDELVGNALRYARANSLSVKITQTDTNLQLTYLDDGVGLKNGWESRHSGGIFNIEKRVRSAGGKVLRIDNRQEGGLVVEIIIPAQQNPD